MAAAASCSDAIASSEREDTVADVSNPWPPVDHRVFSDLIRKMRPSRILDKLFAVGVIDGDEWYDLQRLEPEKAKVRELFGVVLPKKSPAQDVFLKLCRSLRITSGQEEVADMLLEYAKTSASCPSPPTTNYRTAWVWIRSQDERLVQQVENFVAPVFRRMLGILKEGMLIFPTAMPECRPQSGGDTAVPLVLSDSFFVRVLLKGVSVAEFATTSRAREIFIDLITETFGVERVMVEKGLHVSSIDSVGVSLCLPLQNAGLQLIGMYRDRCEEIRLMWEFEKRLSQLTRVDIYIGGLPVWSLPLHSSRDGSLDLRGQLRKLARFDCLLPSLLIDDAYDAGIITTNRYLEYSSCENGRSESKKAIDFISESNDACLESLCNVIKTSESHRLATELLGWYKNEKASDHPTSPSPSVKSKTFLGRYFSFTRRPGLSQLALYEHVQVYVDEHCVNVLERYRKALFNLFETKFGVGKVKWKTDRNIDSTTTCDGQRKRGDKDTIVFVCQSYKTVAIEVQQTSCDDASAEDKAKCLRDALCQALDTSPSLVEIRDTFERSGTWVVLSMPLESVFGLLCGVLDVTLSKAFDRNLWRLFPKATAARMHVGGLPSLSLRPIRRIDGDWSNTGAAIAIPGYVSHVLVCRSSGAYLVNIESNEMEEAAGDNLDVLKDCTALVSVGDKMYAFGSRLYEVTYKPLDSSFQCIQLGDEDWSGTLTACPYENAILAVRTRKLMFGLLPRTNLYYVNVDTGSSQVLSGIYQPWRVVGALVNTVDVDGKENVIAICGSLWKLKITLQDGVVTRIHSTRLDEAGEGHQLIEGFNCLFESMHGRGWQFTRSAAVHNKKLYVATGKHYLPGNVLGGLFRVDPFCEGEYSTVYGGWHTIQTVVDVNRYLVVFTTNKLYVLDVD